MASYTDFYLHTGGQISYGIAGFQYDISGPNAITRRLRLRNKPTLPELMHKIHVKLSLGINDVISRILYRSPMYNRGMLFWTSVDLVDDSDVDMIYEKLREIESYTIVELIIMVTEGGAGVNMPIWGIGEQERNYVARTDNIAAGHEANDIGPSRTMQTVGEEDNEISLAQNIFQTVVGDAPNVERIRQRHSVCGEDVVGHSQPMQSISRHDGNLLEREGSVTSGQGILRRSLSYVPNAATGRRGESDRHVPDASMNEGRRSVSQMHNTYPSQPRRSLSRRVGDFFSKSLFGNRSSSRRPDNNVGQAIGANDFQSAGFTEHRQSGGRCPHSGPSQPIPSVSRQDTNLLENSIPGNSPNISANEGPSFNDISGDVEADPQRYVGSVDLNADYVSSNDEEVETANMGVESGDSESGEAHDFSDTQYVSPLASIHDSDNVNEAVFSFPSEHYNTIDFDAAQVNMSEVDDFKTWDGTSELSIGLVFNSKDEVRNCVKKYSIMRNVDFKVVESKPKYWVLRCANAESGCTWRLRASKKEASPFWKITRFNGPHSCCSAGNISNDHRQLGSQIICNCIREMVSKSPTLPIDVIIAAIKERFHYEVSYYKAWYAKMTALESIFGNYVQSFERLPGYLCALQIYNPGTIYEFVLQETDSPYVKQFQRVFWTFKPSIDGFDHCKPVILIDGTFLTGKFQQTLLIASSIDGNDMLFPLAFAVVESENVSSWSWFMSLIKKHVTRSRIGITVISDRHAGIMSVFRDERSGWKEPRAFHRICLRHFVSNYNTHHRNPTIKKMLYNAGNTYQRRKFSDQMDKIKELDIESYNWAMRVPLERWTFSEDGGHRYGHATTNIAESINSALKGVRMMPITAMVEHVFGRLVKFFEQRRGLYMTKMAQGMLFTPKCVQTMNKQSVKARGHRVINYDSRYKLFSILSFGAPEGNAEINTYIVSLDKRECECGRFQGLKMPCSHAIAACMNKHLDMFSFVDSCYSITEALKCYEGEFRPLAHRAYWPEYNGPKFVPDMDLKRKKGRPRTTRIRNEMDRRERGNVTHCSICGTAGHNKRSCPSRAGSSNQQFNLND